MGHYGPVIFIQQGVSFREFKQRSKDQLNAMRWEVSKRPAHWIIYLRHFGTTKCVRPKTQLPSRHNPEDLRAQLHRSKSLKTRAISTARKFRRVSSPAFENTLKLPSNGDLQETVVSDLGSSWRYSLQTGYAGLYFNVTSAYMPAVISNSCGSDTDEHPRTYFM